MDGIFISYRRDDSAGYAGRLYDRLIPHFGADRVFMDVEGIELGTDFVAAIEEAVGSCRVLIVIIGDEWLKTADALGRRRLDDPHDFIRLETATALKRGIRVVPVLVGGALMPRAEDLPEELKPLARRQAIEISHKQWDATTAELIRALEGILSNGAASAPVPPVPQPRPRTGSTRDPVDDGAARRRWRMTAGASLALAIAGAGVWALLDTQPPSTQATSKPVLTAQAPLPATIGADSTTPMLIPTLTVTPTPEPGSISGTLSYPSEFIPPLRVAAFQVNGFNYRWVDTMENQSAYQITGLTPGLYHVVAYTMDGLFAGGYTQMVPCGLQASCTDHSLIDVKVEAGKD
ncbi:MAG: toll/interleukin-1 receptor domain-containing protein, partial [Comamonadaceae bacterium]